MGREKIGVEDKGKLTALIMIVVGVGIFFLALGIGGALVREPSKNNESKDAWVKADRKTIGQFKGKSQVTLMHVTGKKEMINRDSGQIVIELSGNIEGIENIPASNKVVLFTSIDGRGVRVGERVPVRVEIDHEGRCLSVSLGRSK